MAKESEVPVEMSPVSPPPPEKRQMVDRAVSSFLLMRSASETEIDGGRRNRGQQTHAYDLHKGIAESAMDISLLTANANQLRLLITYNGRSKTFFACITLVIVSLVLQILVACGVIIIRSQPKTKRSLPLERLKIATSIGVSIITVINILVASLVVTDGSGSGSGDSEKP
ncbi:ninjurin-B-like [Malaya genurostris]|uniref:ninjurin-B-like n=1 Tax=Malaya genurostris TaxID=325434 RepID=UPI0026F38DB6|nr:ninjurin-B-like [Malaya genurostris]XP_058450445.1 ninjurin-B-like [Malaya genurostris]XP_058450446.1 ninjurin-B-like [Malaya genurostris]